jgi:hypothetical protein
VSIRNDIHSPPAGRQAGSNVGTRGNRGGEKPNLCAAQKWGGLKVEIEGWATGGTRMNAPEDFWALLKREINGKHVSVGPCHLFRYLDEPSLRYNDRKDLTDADRFRLAVGQIVGKRLTYAGLMGAAGEVC